MLITYSTWVTQIIFATFHGLFDAGGQIALLFLVSLMGTFSEQNVSAKNYKKENVQPDRNTGLRGLKKT